MPSAVSWKPGQIAVIVVAVVHGDGRASSPPSRSGRWSTGSTCGSRPRPVSSQSRSSASSSRWRSPLGIGQVGLAHLDVVQPHDRVDLDRVRVGLLAHELAVHLALGRHVDDEVADDARVAAEPPLRREAAPVPVARLGLG